MNEIKIDSEVGVAEGVEAAAIIFPVVAADNEASKDDVSPFHIRIDDLQRPLTAKGFLNWIEETVGESVDGDTSAMWLNPIKSYCYLSLSSSSQASKFKLKLDGQRYPSSNTKLLTVDFTTVSAKEAETGHAEAKMKKDDWKLPQIYLKESTTHTSSSSSFSSSSLSTEITVTEDAVVAKARNKRKLIEDDAIPSLSLDELFRKTVAVPPLYYLPLSIEQVALKRRLQKKN